MVDDSYRGYRNDPYGRGGSGSSEPATDPLTELARLIGQSDPFGDHNRRTEAQGQGDWRNNSEQPAYPDQNGGYDDRYGTQSDQTQYAQHAGQPAYDDGQHYAQNGGDPYAADGTGQYAANGPDGYAPASAGHYAANGADEAYAHYSEQDGGAGYADPHGYGNAQYQQQAYQQQGYQQQPEYHQEPQPQYADPNGAYHPSQQGGPPNLGPPAFFGADQPAGYDEAPAARRRGWLITVAALVGLAVLGTAGAFAYRAVVSSGPPPLIVRDERPDKVAPPTQNANNASNKAPDRLAVGNEQMAPPPEQPINVAVTPQPQPPPPAQDAAPVAPPAATPPGLTSIQAPPPAATPTGSAGPNGPAAAPRKIRTVTISADQEPGGASLAPPRQIVPHAPPARAGTPNAPLSLAPRGIPDAPARNAAPTRTAALAPTAPQTEGAGGHGYYVQVSAQKSQEEARSSYRGIQAKYANILHGHPAVFRRKDLGRKGVFYGAQVGPFSHEAAVHLCEQLKSAGGSCMIQRN